MIGQAMRHKTTRLINDRHIERYLQMADKHNVGCFARQIESTDWEVSLMGKETDFILLDDEYVNSFK